MPRMGKTEEDCNGLKLGFLKTVQPNSFSKLIPSGCNFKNNAQETMFQSVSKDSERHPFLVTIEKEKVLAQRSQR